MALDCFSTGIWPPQWAHFRPTCCSHRASCSNLVRSSWMHFREQYIASIRLCSIQAPQTGQESPGRSSSFTGTSLQSQRPFRLLRFAIENSYLWMLFCICRRSILDGPLAISYGTKRSVYARLGHPVQSRIRADPRTSQAFPPPEGYEPLPRHPALHRPRLSTSSRANKGPLALHCAADPQDQIEKRFDRRKRPAGSPRRPPPQLCYFASC